MTPEGKIVKSIMDWLAKQPDTFSVKIHGGPYQMAGLPDIWVIRPLPVGTTARGCILYCFEVKQPGNKPTINQARIMEKLRQAGAVAEVVFSLDDVKRLF